ncbi:thiamine pyrophosphokinase [Peribacillus deserti]|uniref:Thiamine diphosphokinase n=1 Tax=Peribacillus deserti TaxID=673318 RepID=A0ABS2QGM3_9BACI|nr:thiamine diphosphokinase [Peribacillus deserti]MBM7692313.1 thiamine pyrophosphokinase [Peribacillus deserti]
MIICILAGGPLELVPDLHPYKDRPDVIWAGVDRGVYSLIRIGIQPNEAFGDFDSVTSEELNFLQEQLGHLHIYPSQKDQTDLEIALEWAMSKKPEKIILFGATGGRADHYLANIQLLAQPGLINQPQSHIYIEDTTNILFLKTPGTYGVKKLQNKKYISFIPITPEIKGITLRGFKYPLENRNISMGSTLCISNELLYEDGTFSFEEGILLVVRSSD